MKERPPNCKIVVEIGEYVFPLGEMGGFPLGEIGGFPLGERGGFPLGEIYLLWGPFDTNFGAFWADFGRLTEEPQLRPELGSTPRPPTGPVPIPTPHPPHPAPRALPLGVYTLR